MALVFLMRFIFLICHLFLLDRHSFGRLVLKYTHFAVSTKARAALLQDRMSEEEAYLAVEPLISGENDEI